MYHYLKHRVKHAIRFRHKRGFGVHSPFMFDLIVNVIKSKSMYYSFLVLESKYKLNTREKKLNRMIFRLANHLGIKHTLLLGASNGSLINYLTTLSKKMVIWNGGPLTFSEETKNISPAELMNTPLDFIYLGRLSGDVWSADWNTLLKSKQNEPLCMIITDIHRKQMNNQLWKQWSKEATVSIDMMWYGILIFNTHLQKGKYNLII